VLPGAQNRPLMGAPKPASAPSGSSCPTGPITEQSSVALAADGVAASVGSDETSDSKPASAPSGSPGAPTGNSTHHSTTELEPGEASAVELIREARCANRPSMSGCKEDRLCIPIAQTLSSLSLQFGTNLHDIGRIFVRSRKIRSVRKCITRK
jgi:hypothetical protein